MPSCNELQAELGTALGQLQVIQRLILEVFEWASQPGMIDPHTRSMKLMELELARTSLPILERHLSNTIQMLIPNR